MATDQDQEGSNKAYLREQQIPLLFDQLLRGLLQRKPDDSLSYLHRTIAELRTSQTHTNKAMNELLLSRVDKRNPEVRLCRLWGDRRMARMNLIVFAGAACPCVFVASPGHRDLLEH